MECITGFFPPIKRSAVPAENTDALFIEDTGTSFPRIVSEFHPDLPGRNDRIDLPYGRGLKLSGQGDAAGSCADGYLRYSVPQVHATVRFYNPIQQSAARCHPFLFPAIYTYGR